MPLRLSQLTAYAYEAMQSELVELKTLLEWYKSQLLSAKRRQFGPSSEKSDPDCRQLSLLGLANVPSPPETTTEEITYQRKKRQGLPRFRPFRPFCGTP